MGTSTAFEWVGRTAPQAGTAARGASRVARIEVLDSMAAAEPVWRALERDAVTTPYQRFDWANAWQRHVGERSDVQPYLVVGRDATGAPSFLWPFGRHRAGAFRVARFLGGKHANFNFALWRHDVAAEIAAADLQLALTQLAALKTGVDLLQLLNQPLQWDGLANPMLLLEHQSSPSNGMRLPLDGTGEEVIERTLSTNTRSRLRAKERKLAKNPGYRYLRARTHADVDRLLDAFLVQKAAQLAQMGVPDVFAAPGVADFLREACRAGLEQGKPLIEVHALECDAELIAFFAAASDGRRLSGMFNSYTESENARQSPGLILLTHLIADGADRGHQMFDLGVGEASYKEQFCQDVEVLADSFIPLTTQGRLATIAIRAAFAAKRRIKHSPMIWKAVGTTRRLLARKSKD